MRIGGGGGYRATTGGTYTIKTMAVTPEPASGYTASAIEELFSYLDPGATAQAGAAHTAASKTLTNIADDLVKHLQVLNENWSGTAAQAAVVNFQQLHETAIGLAQASAQTGAVLSWLGETILPYYKNYKAPGNGVVGDLESLFGHNPQNSAAQAVMERLNNRLAQANDGLPPSVSLHLSLTSQNNGHSSASTSSVGSGGTEPARRPAPWAVSPAARAGPPARSAAAWALAAAWAAASAASAMDRPFLPPTWRAIVLPAAAGAPAQEPARAERSAAGPFQPEGLRVPADRVRVPAVAFSRSLAVVCQAAVRTGRAGLGAPATGAWVLTVSA